MDSVRRGFRPQAAWLRERRKGEEHFKQQEQHVQIHEVIRKMGIGSVQLKGF